MPRCQRGDHGFESHMPGHSFQSDGTGKRTRLLPERRKACRFEPCLWSQNGIVVQLGLERQSVTLEVAGSSPVNPAMQLK